MSVHKIIISLHISNIKKATLIPWLRESVKIKFLNIIFGEKSDRVGRSAGEIIALIFCNKDNNISNVHFSYDAQLRSIFGDHDDILCNGNTHGKD